MWWCESPCFWAAGVAVLLIVIYGRAWVSRLQAEHRRWQSWEGFKYVERLVLCQRLQAALQRLIAEHSRQLEHQLHGSELLVIRSPWWLVLHPAITTTGVDWPQTTVLLGREGGRAFGTSLYEPWDEGDVNSITAILRPCEVRWAARGGVLFNGAFAHELAEIHQQRHDEEVQRCL